MYDIGGLTPNSIMNQTM